MTQEIHHKLYEKWKRNPSLYDKVCVVGSDSCFFRSSSIIRDKQMDFIRAILGIFAILERSVV